MGSRVELFEQIRRDRDREGLSIRALAARHGVHRRAVRQALASPVPPAKRSPVGRPAPKLGAYRALIDEWLEADREAPRKQRHTAQADLAAAGRRARRGGRRDDGRATTCARAGASWADGRGGVRAAGARAGRGGRGRLGRGGGRCSAGARTKVHLFVMRASFSGAAFCQASLVETQQAFLEAARRGVRVVRRRVRAGPLRQPDARRSSRCCKGRRRVETDRFVALRSHYLFESQFTTGRASRARTRRAASRARSAASAATTSSRSRRSRRPRRAQRAAAGAAASATWRGGSPGGRTRSARRWARERPLLRALPAEPFDAAEHATPRVDAKALVTVRQNRYSVPVAPGRAAGQRADRRARDHDQPRRRGGRPPRAAARQVRRPARSSITTSSCSRASPARSTRSLALRQERDRGAWPGCFDELWAALDRPLRALGGRPADGRRAAARAASTAPRGSSSPSAARSPPARTTAAPSRSSPAAPSDAEPRRRRSSGLEPRLAAHARPEPDLADYDQLLGRRHDDRHRTRRPRRWRR